MVSYPYQLRLPLAPYRFRWRDEPAVDAEKNATELYVEERYRHADGTHTIIREYRADGSYHILSDRGQIELVDNAANPCAPDPVSIVRLPLSARDRCSRLLPRFRPCGPDADDPAEAHLD